MHGAGQPGEVGQKGDTNACATTCSHRFLAQNKQQHADDTGWIEVNGTHCVDKIEKETPYKLKDNDLGVNTDKTEKHHVSQERTKMIVGRKSNALEAC